MSQSSTMEINGGRLQDFTIDQLAGASALILGYWSFLLTDAYNTKSIKAILFGSVAVVMYGGFLFILLDVRTHISWVGHASGLVAGIIAANLYFDSENSSAKD